MTDVLGQALWDFYNKLPLGKLWIHNKYGKKEEMPLQVYFREPEDMPDLELIAMQVSDGKVLDIGAGVGSHALAMQQKGIDVTAMELSPKAVEIMKLRGVQNVLQQDIFTYKTEEKFDTLLLLMNGVGLTATIGGLTEFLINAKSLVAPDGQIIFDSSDVAYLYEDNLPKSGNYYGEILYQYEYKKQKTEWFKWLYIDQNLLQQIATEAGWRVEILSEDEYDQYLAKLTLL
jgi:cyclopropane fatty-acyl-phospholipid synthase-like methyltransferase